ncbi:MarR family winged helix-turn-helix transcriptional regulator [Ornithinimicrobium murale]|uniref:MarR family winged helix-turn-helix transcriptional regulator n=1 Tax=Ornithinimicrobium murale TaxID=1050153 RepID=UPI0013B4164E|nr:MarR family transcriptional regulator [Ornithinimicrobium murale]
MGSPIEELDETIVGFRAATQRPAYRQRLLQDLDYAGGISSLRLMRTVERLSGDGPGPSIRQVATELGVEHSTASRSVDTLVRAYLLSRSRCADDQRQVRLQLTEQGRSSLRATTRRRQEVLAALVEAWDPDDVHTLTRLLDRLRGEFDAEFGHR